MQKPALLALLLCFGIAGYSATRKAARKTQTSSVRKTAKPSTSARKSTAKVSSKTAAKTGTKNAASNRKRTRSGKSRAKATPRATWRGGQQTPTPERYKEIQQALIEKGFLQAPATGVWGPDSVEALRKFQGEQNLEPDGKLDALSLIALGLGPRREANGSSAGGIPALTPTAGSAPVSNPVPASPSVSRLQATPSKANTQILQ